MAGTSKIRSFCVTTTTGGEDETSEGNPENSKHDVVDVAPSVPAPEDEAAAEPAPEDEAAAELTTTEPATAEPATEETSTTWTGSSGVRPDARQPDGSRSLSIGHIANRTENDNYSSRSMPPKRPFAISSENGNMRNFCFSPTPKRVILSNVLVVQP